MRALFVHAHPDDEALTTGGTLAALVRAGVDARVATCTLGEEGEVTDPRWAELVADAGDQLGGYRYAELAAALAAVGAGEPRVLGGIGRFRDSGMAGTPAARHPRALVGSGEAALRALVAELDLLRPDLVVTYDPSGGYGHPDHIRVHELVEAAVLRCERPPRRLAWTVTGAADLESVHPEPPAGTRAAGPDELPSVPEDRLTHVEHLAEPAWRAGVAARRAHRTQLTVVTERDAEPGRGAEPERAWFALTNGILQPIPRRECYICRDLEVARGTGERHYRPCPPGTAPLLDGLLDGLLEDGPR